MRVVRDQEGPSSNRPELAALEAALRQADDQEDILYLCDNQSVLTEVNGWIGEGGKATLAAHQEQDKLEQARQEKHQRIE